MRRTQTNRLRQWALYMIMANETATCRLCYGLTLANKGPTRDQRGVHVGIWIQSVAPSGPSIVNRGRKGTGPSWSTRRSRRAAVQVFRTRAPTCIAQGPGLTGALYYLHQMAAFETGGD